MTAKCLFCKDTKIEPGFPGPCIWCEEVGPVTTGTVERFTIAKLRYAGGAEHDVRYVSEVHYDAALGRVAAGNNILAGQRTSLDVCAQQINTLQQRLTVAEQRAGELETALINVRETLGREYWDQYAGLDETRDILDAALKPAEEGEGK